MNKAGVERVVWNRPRPGHKGPIRRSTPFDQIPFLAVARSLGDLWSYNYLRHEFVVSPDPDVDVININPRMHRCVIFASDGLWNMLTTQCAVKIVQTAEEENEKLILEGGKANGMGKQPNNPSKLLVDAALKHWFELGMRADNTSVVTVMLDPPGPPKSEVLLRQRVMKRLRPRDEQGDEDSNSSSGNAFDASCTLNSKDKKKTGDCLELQPSRERKRSSDSFTEVVSKERKLSSDTDETVPKNLPKPVILSPQRVVIKHKIPSSPQSPVIASCVPSVEKKQTFTKLSSADINLLSSSVTDVKSKKKGHDPPKEEQNKGTETTNENINDPPGTVFETINDSAERECGESSEPKNTLNENYQGKQSTFPNKALDRTDSMLPKIGKESSLPSPDMGCKENGRIHLCEVENFFKLNNRTLDCVETANDVKQNVSPNDSKPVPSKIKNLRKRSLRRNHSVYQKSDASLKHRGLQGKNFSVHSGLHEKSNPSRTARKTRTRLTHCHKTRAQVELRKIKL
ncbi:Protein phosphatase 1D, partial [Stegodyphus mimosarum]